ncbi:MAG: PEP-utilizing enzyme, partial [Anaerolineae bacterium]
LPHNVTTEMDLALWATAQQIKADAAAAAAFKQADAVALARGYEAGQLPPVAQTALSAFLRRYGMRGVGEIDIGRRRWREDPTQIMQVVQSYLNIEDPNQAPDVVFKRGAVTAKAAIEHLTHAIRRGKRGWIKARLARAAARRIRALAGLRETPKFSIIRAMGILRQVLLDSGRALVAAGILEQAEDVFFLTTAELQQLASGARAAWKPLVAARRASYDREKQRRQVPRLLLSDGQVFYAGLGASNADGAITGSPVSPGVVEGVVHVVLDPRGAQLAPGEILVCPGTDPAWTPLFLAAGGLVMEVGGLMTHGSVVAREYGIPAVVGVHEATTRLKTGQRIRVDGSVGRVTVLTP